MRPLRLLIVSACLALAAGCAGPGYYGYYAPGYYGPGYDGYGDYSGLYDDFYPYGFYGDGFYGFYGGVSLQEP